MMQDKTFVKNKIDIISMGCSKNLVDSERLIRCLEKKGYTVSHDTEEPDGEIVIVNTCGFIADAKEESIQLLLELASLKEQGRIGSLMAMGCLTERYREEIKNEIPEIDRLYGKFDWNAFVSDLPDMTSKHQEAKSWERSLTTSPHHAYLKISEGCNRFCAFCAIPLITGRHKSRSIEDIEEEVKWLVKKGVKEFNIICQDLSSYGTDLYGRHALAELLERLANIEGVKWLRLHYAYPSDFPMDVLPVMARRDNICKYLDIALQHGSDKVLSNMRRHITRRETEELIREIRRQVPDIKLRTTMMVGFPGEGEKEFEELLDFVREMKFDRLGAFAYSEEEDTWAAKNLEDSVSEEVKQSRLDRLMELQQDISETLAADMVGRTLDVVVDEVEGYTRLCRSQFESPEVDPVIYVRNSSALPGEFITVKVTGSDFYDLEAEEISKNK